MVLSAAAWNGKDVCSDTFLRCQILFDVSLVIWWLLSDNLSTV